MNATLAIMAREVIARRELLLFAVCVAVMVCLLPFWPGVEGYEATDVRTVSSGIVALTLGCLLALVLGATVFGRDLSEGRLGFFFARPVSGLAVWWGRVLAVMALIWIVEVIVLVPALYAEGVDIFTSSGLFDWLTILTYILAPLLLFLLAHSVSVMARARTPWLILDMCGAMIVAFLGWLHVKPFNEIGAPIAMWVVAGAFIAALLISLSIGGAVGVSVGRVDLRRAHGAQSLALWGTLAICVAAITVYGGWLRNFGPRDFSDVEVMSVAPDGGWVEAVGRAGGRLDVKRRYLLSTTAEKWVPLPPRSNGYQDDARYSTDGSTAIWRGDGSVEEPRSLWWANLGRPDPMARATNLVVSPRAALTLSVEGARLAILEEGTVSIYELDDERLVKAIRLPEGFERVAVIFVSSGTMRLFGISEIGEKRSLRIGEIDVASGELTRTGEIHVGEKDDRFWFSVDSNLEYLIVGTRRERSREWTRAIYNARTGEFLRSPDAAGSLSFLRSGRMMFDSEADDGSIELTVETVDGENRLVHNVRAAFGSRIIGEAVPNGVIVAHLVDPSNRAEGIRLVLLDIDTGETRNIGSQVRSLAGWNHWQPGFDMSLSWQRNHLGVCRLFIDQSGALVRWDPETGKMVHVVGGKR